MSKILGAVAAVGLMGALVAMAAPDTSVEVKAVHICCGSCEKAVGKILDDAGVKGKGDKQSKTISFSAADTASAQKVIDALAAGGFQGEIDSKDLAFKQDSGAKEGKVTSLTVKGFHNCCPACCKAIKAVLAKVDGVESEDTKPKAPSCTVKGNFDPVKLVKALNDAGFHVSVEAGN